MDSIGTPLLQMRSPGTGRLRDLPNAPQSLSGVGVPGQASRPLRLKDTISDSPGNTEGVVHVDAKARRTGRESRRGRGREEATEKQVSSCPPSGDSGTQQT